MTGATLSGNLGGGNVTILSNNGRMNGGGTSGSGDINVNDAVSWSTNTLTLNAANNININAVMTAKGTSALVMNTATANGSDAAVPGGSVKVGFNPDGTFKGRVDFFQADGVTPRSGTGFLTINGNGYTVINALTDLQNINSGLAGYHALGANVDASATSGWNGGAGFVPIGNNTLFTGGFDGLGHTVTGLYINRPTTTYVGLFGYASNGSMIRNVGMVDVNITSGRYVGGLVGWNNGGISNSYSTGAVTGSGDYVGGLVGGMMVTWGGGRREAGGVDIAGISNSYSTGAVTGSGTMSAAWWGGIIGTHQQFVQHGGGKRLRYYVGGLVGWNDGGTISNSYSTGAVTGSVQLCRRPGGV